MTEPQGRMGRCWICALEVTLPYAFVAALMPTATALAQSDPPAARGEGIERIERVQVTGSNIPQVDGEGPVPLQTIDRAQIQRSGVTTATELLSHVSANVNGLNNALGIAASAAQAGLTSANLRGLGGGSTLILLNGRRLANYAFDGGTVDLDSIPLAAIDRVEILKDGASAIYGTDAIGGVINFVTRKDFRGAEIDGNFAQPEHGGARHRQVTVSAGFGSLAGDRFNVFATIDYQHDTALRAIQRPFSRTVLIPAEGVNSLTPTTLPANIVTDYGILNPAFSSGCAPPAVLPNADDFGEGCGFDYATYADLLPVTESVNIVSRATYQLAAEHQLFAEFVYARKKITSRLAPTPAAQYFTFDGEPILYPANGPFYPTAFAEANGISGDLNVFYRALPLGPRIDEMTSDAQRLTLGADGVLAGWTYNAALARSEDTNHDKYVSGFVSEARLVAAMATGLINPFGPSGPAGDALLATTQIGGDLHHAQGTTYLADARASKDIAELPAGPLAIALGVEARRESFDDIFDPVWSSGNILAGGGQDQSKSASRHVEAAFAELNFPVTKQIEAQLAARVDHYSDFGNSINPKIAVRWQPLPAALVRASYGTGFRAPTLYDLFTPLSRGLTGFTIDPARCATTQLASDCALGFQSLVGGNPALKPETSEQFNAGVVVEPAPGLSLSVDYWSVNKRRTIGDLGEDTLLRFFDVYSIDNIIRAPVDPAYPNLPGPIRFVVLPRENLGNLRTSGVDVDLRYRTPTRIGRFTLHLNGTYVGDWSEQFDGVSYTSGAGRNVAGPIPRWRHYASLDWDYGVWSATLAQNFISGYVDANLNPAGDERRVGAYETWDAQCQYAGIKNVRLVGGVRNLLDRAPPFSNQNNTSAVGFDPTYTDARGRTFYVTLSYGFR